MSGSTVASGYQSVFSGTDVYKYNGSVNKSCVTIELSNYDKNNNKVKRKDNAENFFEGLCAQGIQAQAGQQPQMIYELGTNNYYEIASKPSGSGTLQNVFGPTSASITALKELANLCHETKLKIQVVDCANNCDKTIPSGGQTMVFAGGFLTSVQLSATAQSFLLNGSWSFTFQDLQEQSKS